MYYCPLRLRKRSGNNLTNTTAAVIVAGVGVAEMFVLADGVDAAIVEYDVDGVAGGDQMRLRKPFHFLLHLWNVYLFRL